MSIKTDAMIAHNGADGYTLHVDYDPDTDNIELKAIFNDGTEKSISGDLGDGSNFDQLLDGSLAVLKNENVTRIRSYGASQMNNLASVDLPNVTQLGTRAFYLDPVLENVNLPNVETVNSSALESVGKVRVLILPKAVFIGNTAFKACPLLEYVYIGSAVTSFSASAFADDADLVIDCGFASTDPAAANAPWGAINATIHYDVAEPNPPELSSLSISPDPGLIQNIDFEPIDIQPAEPDPVVEVKKTKRSAK